MADGCLVRHKKGCSQVLLGFLFCFDFFSGLDSSRTSKTSIIQERGRPLLPGTLNK